MSVLSWVLGQALRTQVLALSSRGDSECCDIYGNRDIFNLLWGQEEKATDPTWHPCIREGFLELVTFSKTRKYKQVFEDGEKRGRKDIPH